MNSNIDSIKIQHEKSYRNAINELIKNNTEVLVDQDISSLINKPPLDSMDFLKTKFLSLAKKNKIVLNTECLDRLLDKYRKELLKISNDIRNIRTSDLIKILDNTELDKKDVLKLNKKDFESINKKIIKMVKDKITEENDIVKNNIFSIFSKNIDDDIKNKVIEEAIKYMNSSYRKQIIDGIEVKMVVKDITLINLIKEQGERYLFTMENSRLFHDLD